MSHQACPRYFPLFSGELFGFPGEVGVVVVDVRALIERQKVVAADRPFEDTRVAFGGELVTVRLSKLTGDEWRDLMDAAPPRAGVEGDQSAGFNQKVIAAKYPVASIAFGGESVTADEWAEIHELLEPSARNMLAMAIFKVNLGDPMMKLLALGKAGSGVPSGSPANRESRRAASKGGSQRMKRSTSTTTKDV